MKDEEGANEAEGSSCSLHPSSLSPNRIVSTVDEPNIKVVVELRGLHKTYDAGGQNPVHALRGLELDVPARQYVAVMGASGSGKSTLLNILGALDVPTRGTYRLAGQVIPLGCRSLGREVDENGYDPILVGKLVPDCGLCKRHPRKAPGRLFPQSQYPQLCQAI